MSIDVSNVYVIGSASGQHKIGISANPTNRLIALQTANPMALSLARSTVMLRSEAREVERHAHWLLRHQRSSGEWFSCSLDEALTAVDTALRAVRAGTARLDRNPDARTRKVGRKHAAGGPRKTSVFRLDPELVAEIRGMTSNFAETVEDALRIWIADSALKPVEGDRKRPCEAGSIRRAA